MTRPDIKGDGGTVGRNRRSSHDTQVAAIKGGGDWYDASVDFIIIPRGFNFEEARSRYENWYRNVYLKQPRGPRGEWLKDRIKYMGFAEWLVKHEGAHVATDDDVIQVWDGP